MSLYSPNLIVIFETTKGQESTYSETLVHIVVFPCSVAMDRGGRLCIAMETDGVGTGRSDW